MQDERENEKPLRKLAQDDAVGSNLDEQTREVLSILTPIEEKVLRMRTAGHTLEKVGQDLTATPEGIHKIEAGALRKLRTLNE